MSTKIGSILIFCCKKKKKIETVRESFRTDGCRTANNCLSHRASQKKGSIKMRGRRNAHLVRCWQGKQSRFMRRPLVACACGRSTATLSASLFPEIFSQPKSKRFLLVLVLVFIFLFFFFALPPFNQNGALQSGQQINGRKMLLTVGQMMSCFTENETFLFLSCLSELWSTAQTGSEGSGKKQRNRIRHRISQVFVYFLPEVMWFGCRK